MPIKTIDLCAGIGGIRIGVEQAANDLATTVTTVAAIENDPNAAKVYEANFGISPLADLTDDQKAYYSKTLPASPPTMTAKPSKPSSPSSTTSATAPHGKSLTPSPSYPNTENASTSSANNTASLPSLRYPQVHRAGSGRSSTTIDQGKPPPKTSPPSAKNPGTATKNAKPSSEKFKQDSDTP